jgi:hypothetical protein
MGDRTRQERQPLFFEDDDEDAWRLKGHVIPKIRLDQISKPD